MPASRRTKVTSLKPWLVLIFLAFGPFSNAEEKPLVKSLYGQAGFSYSIDDKANAQGGVNAVNSMDDWGFGLNIGALFNKPFAPPVSPYIEATYLNPGDRHFSILGGGLRYDWTEKSTQFTPYASVGLGYLRMRWDDLPAKQFNSEYKSGSSGVVTGQAGMLWSLTEQWGIDLRARYDIYDVTTTLVQNNKVTQLEDRSSMSFLLGLVYQFGKKLKDGDDDQDGVLNSIDQCPDTLYQVPVNEVGCPRPYFKLDLMFEFAKFELANLVNRPNFPVLRFLEKHPHYHISIAGHTDTTGDESFNQYLSEQRAEEARKFLLENGIDETRIQSAGHGQHAPIAENTNKEGRQLNRRITVEFYIPENEPKE